MQQYTTKMQKVVLLHGMRARAQVTTINRCAVEKTVAGKNSDGTKKSKQTEKKTMNESIVIGC